MKAIIPIGGRGTRMRPVTFTANKHFIPVGNKPLIYYPLQTISDSGITEIAITYNPGQLDYAREKLGDGSRWGATFTFIEQPEPIGLANIIEVCEEWMGDSQFVCHLGDNIFVDGIKEIVEYFEKKRPDGLVTMVHHPENRRMGVPYFDKNNRLVEYVEKPEDPPHDFAVPGLYFGNKNFFKSFKGRDRIKPSGRGEYEMPTAYQWLIDHKYRVDVVEYNGIWLDPGKFGDWLETNQFLLDNKIERLLKSEPDFNSKIEGRVEIGEGCRITNSTVRGPVSIGKNVTIENSFIGPYTSIYDNCLINSCHVGNSVVMESVRMENLPKPVDSSIIGPNSEVTGGNNQVYHQLFIGEMGKVSL